MVWCRSHACASPWGGAHNTPWTATSTRRPSSFGARTSVYRIKPLSILEHVLGWAVVERGLLQWGTHVCTVARLLGLALAPNERLCPLCQGAVCQGHFMRLYPRWHACGEDWRRFGEGWVRIR